MIAESLWDQLKEDTTQFHQRIVELYLQLHNLTASPSLCANVIGNSLIDISKVNTRQLLHQDEKMRYYFLVLSCYLHSIARVALDSTGTWGESSIRFFFCYSIQSQHEFQFTICLNCSIPKWPINCRIPMETRRKRSTT